MTKLNQGEKLFCEWQLGMSGKFHSLLIEAMIRADDEQQEKLYLGYPNLMQAVVSYRNVKGYWADLKSRYETEYNNGKKLVW